MDSVRWVLEQGDALNRCLVSSAIEQRYAVFAEPETMEDRVKYRFENGFVDVGDLPCRKIFWEEMAGRIVDANEAPATEVIHCADGNSRVDYSLFRHHPIHVQRWARVTLHAEAAGDYEFSLATCGGVRIWIDQKPVVQFTPFDRNTEHQQAITLPLNAGRNELLIHFEEICERDTYFYYELIKQDKKPLEYSLGEVDLEALNRLETLANTLYIQNVTANRKVLVSFCEALEASYQFAAGISQQKGLVKHFLETDVEGGCQSLEISLPEEIFPGSYNLSLTITKNGLSVDRTYDLAVLNNQRSPETASLEERKSQAIRLIANEGMPGPAKLLAILKTGENVEAAEDIALTAMQKISRRDDCSDFAIIPMLWAWREHAWEELPEHLWKRMRTIFLGYRYWLDEPGNDCMWFWSENHVLCFHVAQYLAGSFFPNDMFISSGRLGKEQKTIARERLNLWFEHVLADGLVEWNSSSYYPIDYIGLIALYHFTDDADMKEKAQIVLDRLMMMSAAHYQQGIAAGTMGRIYEEGLMASMLNELSGYGHVAWGKGWHTRMAYSLPMFCASSYEPPVEANEIANWNQPEGVQIQYTQGMNRSGKVTAWKQKDVTLSSVVDHKTGEKGHQQHVVDVQLADSPQARIWINHPGEEVPGGSGRPSFWAGNGVLPRVMQHQNRAALIFDLGESPRIPYTHIRLAVEAMEEVQIHDHWCFARCAEGFAAIYSAQKLVATDKGVTAGQEVKAFGEKNAWYVVVDSEQKAGSFAGFVERFRGVTPEFDQQALEFKLDDPELGEVKLNWNGEFTVTGEAVRFPETVGVEPVISR